MQKPKVMRVILIITIWIVGNCSAEKDSVYCELMNENRTGHPWSHLHWAFDDGDDETKVVITQIEIIKCNLNENTGFYYNQIDWNLTDIYELYGDKNETETIFESEDFQDFFNQKDNSSLLEISFEYAEWHLLPNGFDILFPKVNSINITSSGLVAIFKENFLQFGDHLRAANFSNNLIIFVTSNLFDNNKNLKYCDFSNNPIIHIDEFHYFAFWFHVMEGVQFGFENVDCRDKSLLLANETVNCTNPGYVINYEDLENNLKRDFKETELECSISFFCEMIDADYQESAFLTTLINITDSRTYKCNMNVLSPRTYVKTLENFTDNRMQKENSVSLRIV